MKPWTTALRPLGETIPTILAPDAKLIRRKLRAKVGRSPKPKPKPKSASYPFRDLLACKPPALLAPKQAIKFVLFPRTGTAKAKLLDQEAAELERQTHESRRDARIRSMLNWVEVLSTPTADTGACLAVHFDNRRYLFGNVSEGTQRLLVQRRMSARNIEDIFLTGSINWQNTGGLLGMILTIGDAAAGAKAALKEENEKRAAKGQKEKPASFAALNIHGPRNLTHLLATARKFVFRQGFPLRPHEIRTDPRAHGTCTAKEPDWQDGNLRVWHVPLAHKGRRWRKRSHEALSDSEGDNGVPSRPASQRDQTGPAEKGAQDEPLDAETAHQIRAKAVHDMFDSGWKLDTLKEVPLNTVKLPATLFMRDASGHIVKYDGPLPNGRDLVPDIKVLVRSPWPSALIDSLPPTTQYAESMCYIVKNQARRGKFKVDEARRLGVAQTNFKRLTAGESVPGKDNLTVTPEMVLEPTIEGHGFIIVEVPYISYIESFLSRPEWAAEDVMRGIEAMYWIIKSPEVLQDSRIMSFMQERSSMKHIILSRDTCPNHLPLVSPASEAIKLNRIDPDRFPIPTYSNKPNPPESFGVPDPPYQAAQAGAGLQLAPQVIFQDDKAAPYLDTAQVLKEIHGQSEVIALANAAKAKVSDPAFLAAIEEADKDIPNRDMEVVALGTGSALPSKNRNVSATLIRVPGHGSYLLDCGENTLGQLRRVYGFEGADEIVRDLRAIFISHLHADHHLGAVSVIRRHRDLRYGSSPSPDGDAPRPLGIIAHAHFHDFLTEYKDVEAYLGANVERLVMNEQPRSRTGRSTRVADGARTLRYGLSRVETCFVDHCHGAMAVALTLHPSGLKVAYSGDCRPSAEFAAVGRGAHLLVHESTFDDELAGDALAKKHCTMSEALGVARLMGARRVLLTHFSQRYPKIPVIGPDAGPAEVAAESPPSSEEGGAGKKEGDAGAAAGDMSVLFAFDYMRVKLGDFRKAEAFLPAVQKLYEGLEKD